MFGFDPSTFDQDHRFVTSPFCRPIILASVRALLAIYCFTTIIVSYARATHNVDILGTTNTNSGAINHFSQVQAIGKSFSYLEYLSYWAMAFYFLFATIHTRNYAMNGRCWLHSWSTVLQALHSILYTSIVCLPFLVTVVYWASEWSGSWPDHRFDAWNTISIHVLNSVFAIIEIVVANTTLLPWVHLAPLMIVWSLYLALAYITHATQGFYVYSWLDPTKGPAKIVVHVIVFTILIVVIFAAVRSLIWLRIRLTKTPRSTSSGGMSSTSSIKSNSDCPYQDLEKAVDKLDTVSTVEVTALSPPRNASLAPIPKRKPVPAPTRLLIRRPSSCYSTDESWDLSHDDSDPTDPSLLWLPM